MSEKDSKIILTHRTTGNLHALVRAFFRAWFMVSANECLVVRFEVRPIYEPDEADALHPVAFGVKG